MLVVDLLHLDLLDGIKTVVLVLYLLVFFRLEPILELHECLFFLHLHQIYLSATRDVLDQVHLIIYHLLLQLIHLFIVQLAAQRSGFQMRLGFQVRL